MRPISGYQLTGNIIFPDNPCYDEARMDFNTRFSKYPKAIVFCTKIKDVVNTVNYCRKTGIPLRVRAGRHSYEALSNLDCGIVIDISCLRHVCVNKHLSTATVGSGIGLLQLYEKLWHHGFTFPGGTCPSVGLPGLTLGGGFGMLSRLYGLACDNVLGLEMVCANGEVIQANNYCHQDLLWASRGGGGGNFGVVTSFHLKIYPVSEVAIYDITWNWSNAAQVINEWQEWAPTTDERVGSILQVGTRQDGTVKALGMFAGPQNILEQLLAPLLAAGTPTSVEINTVPYICAVYKFAGVDVPHRFKNTGAYAYQVLPAKAITTLLSFLQSSPSPANQIEFSSLAGSVSRICPTATAYIHRPALYNLQYISQWEHTQEQTQNIQWLNALRLAMLPYTVGTYVNFPDLDIVDWPRAYYGINFHSLQNVKENYDPHNLFNFAQSIPLK